MTNIKSIKPITDISRHYKSVFIRTYVTKKIEVKWTGPTLKQLNISLLARSIITKYTERFRDEVYRNYIKIIKHITVSTRHKYVVKSIKGPLN